MEKFFGELEDTDDAVRYRQLRRVVEATRWLEALALDHHFVAIVTHGSFRRELSASLRRSGWSAESATSAFRHWSVWMFTKARQTN